MQLSQKKQFFAVSCCIFERCIIFSIFSKEDDLIADVFLKLRTPKHVVK